MRFGLRKIDAIIVVALLVIAGLFLYRAGYFEEPSINFYEPTEPTVPVENETEPEYLPPTSFIPSFRRDVSPDDEGVHFDKLSISREWWYFGAVFNDPESELQNWTVAISFNHMARGDLLGTRKPDLFLVSLFGNSSESYGGMINKQRYLGILNSGTLIASSPGVSVEFENSWAEGNYPDWHVHAEDQDIDKNHDIVIDLDYHAPSLPIWTIGTRAFDKSKSDIATYLFMGCEVSGTIHIDGIKYFVKGAGHHEHSWTPHVVTKGSINGWDWFYLQLDNGWQLYSTNYYPTPQAITTKTPTVNPFSSLLLTTDNGDTITELKDVDITITRTEDQQMPFVKMPIDFELFAKPSLDPTHLISQSLLFGTNTEIEADIETRNAIDKIWKFPAYLHMKVGYTIIEATISFSDDDGDHRIPVEGIGISWNMRAFL